MSQSQVYRYIQELLHAKKYKFKPFTKFLVSAMFLPLQICALFSDNDISKVLVLNTEHTQSMVMPTKTPNAEQALLDLAMYQTLDFFLEFYFVQ